MGSASPCWDYECPKYIEFDGSFDKENVDDISYFAIDHEADMNTPMQRQQMPLQIIDGNQSSTSLTDESLDSENLRSKSMAGHTQSSKKSLCTRIYELRPTPSRISRLSHLLQTDTESYVRSSMMTATPYILRPKTPQSLNSKKAGSSIDVQNLRVIPSKLQYISGCDNISSKKPERTPSASNLPLQTLDSTDYSPVYESKEKQESELLNLNICKENPQENTTQLRERHVHFDVKSEGLKFNTPANQKFKLLVANNLTPAQFNSVNYDHSEASPITSRMKNSGNAAKKTNLIKRFGSTSKFDRKKALSLKRLHSAVHLEVDSAKKKIDAEFFHAVKVKSRNLNAVYQMPHSSKQERVKRVINAETKINHTTVTKQTIVKPFNFQTDKRVKSSEARPATKEVNFVHDLRHHTPKAKPPQATVLKPFNFSMTSKRKREESSEHKTKTLAETVEQFLKSTPERFRSKAPGTEFHPQETFVPQVVQPRSPNLRAVKRHRPIKVMSHEQVEELEVQKMKEYKFHAQPFNKRLLSSPHLAKPEVKPPTKPMEVHLETEKRTLTHQKKEKDEEPYVFHAQEIPKNILKGPVGIKDKKIPRLTEPTSPAFALKQRSEKWRDSNSSVGSEWNSSFQFKANPVPSLQATFVVKHEKKCTALKPFSFEQADKERFALKEKKIQEEIENERKKAEFYAHPLPASILTPRQDSVCNSSKKPLTKPVPFNLHLDKVIERRGNKKLKTIEEEQVKDVMKFKAQPASVIKKRPFVPKIYSRPVITAMEPCLSTQKRAVERMKLKELQMSTDAEKEAEARKQQQEKEQREQEEIRKLRQQTVHKANPVRCYKTIKIKHSEKPLTEPCAPKFATDVRLNKRAAAERD